MFIEQAYKGNNTWWRVLITAAITMGVFIMNLVMFLVLSKEDMTNAYDLMKQIPKNLSLFIKLERMLNIGLGK